MMNSLAYANIEQLVDINDVSVDKNLPKNERLAEYTRQIKNPHHFKCGKFIIIAKYSNNGISLEDRIKSIIF